MFRNIVVVVVVAVVVTGVAGDASAQGFADTATSVHHDDIEAIAAEGITKGCNPPSNTDFCPGEVVTRGQMAAFLARTMRLPAAPGTDPFSDDNGSVFEADIERISAAGITSGCNPPANTRFCPGDGVTRGQMAAFLARALELPAMDGSDSFSDDNGSVFEGDIERIAAAGITRGCSPPDNSRYCPGDLVTRGQMASFLARAFGLEYVCDSPTATPDGALDSQPGPVFCDIVNSGPATFASDANRWVDDFNHGLSFASADGAGYRVFDVLGGVHRSINWRHADHWMVDMMPNPVGEAGPNGVAGGSMLSPDRAFRFEDGTFVVEFDMAAAHPDYGGSAWGEVVISTAPAPPRTRTGLYGYDMFPGEWALGCRMEAGRTPVCSLMTDAPASVDPITARAWEMSFHQHVGTSVFGGEPGGGRGDFWRECGAGDPDAVCRDRFWLELTETSLSIYANGELYFRQTGLPPLPEEMLNGDLYVYMASMVARHPSETIRFHWDRIAVNPGGTPGPADTFPTG